MSHSSTVTFQTASEPGALDGYLVTCETCGPIGSSSLESLARTMYADGHQKYMEGK